MNFQHYLFSILFMRLLKQLSNVKKKYFQGGGDYKKNLNGVGSGTTPERGDP